MLDWIKHQLAVWRYGVGLLFVVGAWIAICLAAGALLAWPASYVFDFDASWTAWAICTIIVAPFFLADMAESLSDTLKRQPAPGQLRKRWGVGEKHRR